MPISLVEGKSLLALDIGAVTTRASYFDVVEGRYRFIGMGQSPTTLNTPARDLGVGMLQAIQNLQALIGNPLVDADGRLILSQPDGSGIESLVVTLSAGQPLKTLVVGLLSDISLESAQKLARAGYTRIVDSIGINDKRKPEEQIDSILKMNPDLIILAGGADGGATKSLEKMIEVIGLAAYLLPEEKRPAILFAGNKDLSDEVETALKSLSPELHIVPNIRPSLQVEDLSPAQRELADIQINLRKRQMPGVDQLQIMAGGTLLPTAYAQGRMIRFLNQYFNSGKGALFVDIGATAVTLAASFEDDLHLNIFPQFGLGESLAGLLRQTSLEAISQWLPTEITDSEVRDYLYQKSLHPGLLPVSAEELILEEALAKHNLNLAMQKTVDVLPKRYALRPGMLPPFEPIVISGSVITNAPTLGQTLLLILDSLQPSGVTTLVLDPNALIGVLGAAAEQNAILPVHVMDSGAFHYLATVISPISSAPLGTPIVKARLIYNDGNEVQTEVKTGNLQALPLAVGQTAQLQLRPLNRADVGLGPGRACQVDVTGGSLGVVIDARGRPLMLPSDGSRRRDLLKKWLKTVGG
jgi:hypothetical protein